MIPFEGKVNDDFFPGHLKSGDIAQPMSRERAVSDSYVNWEVLIGHLFY